MKNQKDQYNFSRPSTSSEAGFEVFREEKNKLYYFHVNDDNGKILLYSQGYKTKRGRDNGIRSIIQNRRDRSRYSITQEAEYKYYFVLKARNSQEIARSNYFVSEKQIEEKIQYLMESSFSYSFVQKQKRKARSLASKKSNKMTTSANYSLLKKTPKPKTALNKHAFRIDIYNKEDGMVGKIEHLLSKEKVSFTHLDFAAIQDFMEQFILPGKKEKELKKSSISALSFIPEKVEKPAITKLESDAGLSLSLSQTEAATKEEVEQIFEESTQPLSTQVLVEKLAPPKKASSQNAFEYLFINTAETSRATNIVNGKSTFYINAKLPQSFQIDANNSYVKFELLAKSLDMGISINIGDIGYRLLSNEERISIPIMPNTLMPGTYRLNIRMSQEQDHKNFVLMEGAYFVKVF